MKKPTFEQVKELREKHNLTYASVATMLGSPFPTCARWLTGATKMPVPAWRLLNILCGECDPMTGRFFL